MGFVPWVCGRKMDCDAVCFHPPPPAIPVRTDGWTAAHLEWLQVLHPNQASFMKKQEPLVLAMCSFTPHWKQSRFIIIFSLKQFYILINNRLIWLGWPPRKKFQTGLLAVHKMASLTHANSAVCKRILTNSWTTYSLSPLLLCILMAPKWAT